MRKPIIAGNWKMHKTITEALELVRELSMGLKDVKDVDVVVCPAFTALYSVSQAVDGTNIKVGAQNLFWEKKAHLPAKYPRSCLRTRIANT